MDGTVVAANEELKSDPERVNRDPYGLGWIVRLRTDAPRRARRHLQWGVPAERSFRHDVDRFVATVGKAQDAIPSFADGGVLTDRIDELIDDQTWLQLRSELFDATLDSHAKEVES